MVEMQNFQDSFETRKRSFISAFSICMTIALSFPNIVLARDILKNYCPKMFYSNDSV